MPRGPKGEKRRADVIGNAVHVMRIATGEIDEPRGKAPKRANETCARASFWLMRTALAAAVLRLQKPWAVTV